MHLKDILNETNVIYIPKNNVLECSKIIDIDKMTKYEQDLHSTNSVIFFGICNFDDYKQLVCHYGPVYLLWTDNTINFNLKIVKDMCKIKKKIKNIATTYRISTILNENDIANIILESDKLEQHSLSTENISDSNINRIIISVIMISSNDINTFKSSINNILSQTIPYYELIVVDVSNNNLLYREKENFINQLDNKMVKIIKVEKTDGLSVPLNKGINMSTGKYITWINDDNTYYQNFLEQIILNIGDNDFSYSSYDCIDGHTLSCNNNQYYNLEDILHKYKGIGACAWKKEFMDSIGTFDEDILNVDGIENGMEEYEYIVRTFFNTEKVKFIPNSLMRYNKILKK